MKAFKIILIIIGVVVLIAATAGTYVKLALPDTGPAENITISPTAKRIERGRYLANHVTVCMDRHSSRDWSLFAGPISGSQLGGGGEVFDQKMGFPGSFYAANITPYKLKSWTDGEVLRAVTTGVNKEGKALFPLMASHRFGKMDREDVYSIIAYIRTLAPVKKDIPESKADFPVNFLINTMPKKANFQALPQESDTVSYGGYLVNATGCVDCHSKMDKGAIIPGTEFGGGMEFNLPTRVVRSSNITADKATGIGSWTKENFVARFKAYADSSYVPIKVNEGEMNTPMPWMMYSGMKVTDLKAIYAYLRTVKPIANQVAR